MGLLASGHTSRGGGVGMTRGGGGVGVTRGGGGVGMTRSGGGVGVTIAMRDGVGSGGGVGAMGRSLILVGVVCL